MRIRIIYLEWRSRGSPWGEGQKDLPGVEVERITMEGGSEDLPGVEVGRMTLE